MKANIKKRAHVSASQWFKLGERIPYDHQRKEILSPDQRSDSPNIAQVFRRVVRDDPPSQDAVWTTFLPGFPDGSFGWAKVDRSLAAGGLAPRLFVEYIGQGDSDKPANYPYNTFDRADQVEALWRAQGVESTFVVTFDFSSLVILELLRRQQERIGKHSRTHTRIKRVLIINGGLFADAHSHPWLTTPLLKSPIGRMGTWAAQRSKHTFNEMIKVLWSKEYKVTPAELGEYFDAVTRRNGASFMSKGARFVDEHKANAHRWDLRRVFLDCRESVSFHIAGSEGDQFEPNQIVKSKERLGKYGLDIRMLPGGHLTTSEHPELLAQTILELWKQSTGHGR